MTRSADDMKDLEKIWKNLPDTIEYEDLLWLMDVMKEEEKQQKVFTFNRRWCIL